MNQRNVLRIREKPEHTEAPINGGFFVLEPEVLSFIDDDTTRWEQDSLDRIAQKDQLMGYAHNGFWQPMDTLREKRLMEDLWATGHAPWKVWK
jgi:glucose-1-phosphate cytidylyltransferase